MQARNQLLIAALLSLSGCPNEVGGPFSTFGVGGTSPTTTGGGTSTTSGATSADGGSEDGFDAEECAPKYCDNDPADCCEGVQPNLPTACPSSVYPNNWSCVSNECVNAGCANNADCVVPDLSCLQIASVGACVPVCDDDLDCTELDDADDDGLAHALPGTTCSGVADVGGTEYCVQPLP